MNNLLRKVMERTANLRSTSERRMEEVKIGVLPKTGLGINVLASDAVHRVIAARAFGVRVTLPLKDLLLLPGKSLPQACSNRLAENISNEQAIASAGPVLVRKVSSESLTHQLVFGEASVSICLALGLECVDVEVLDLSEDDIAAIESVRPVQFEATMRLRLG
jgi:hypothetical protein